MHFRTPDRNPRVGASNNWKIYYDDTGETIEREIKTEKDKPSIIKRFSLSLFLLFVFFCFSLCNFLVLFKLPGCSATPLAPLLPTTPYSQTYMWGEVHNVRWVPFCPTFFFGFVTVLSAFSLYLGEKIDIVAFPLTLFSLCFNNILSTTLILYHFRKIPLRLEYV